jgi:hypothetical protein
MSGWLNVPARQRWFLIHRRQLQLWEAHIDIRWEIWHQAARNELF